MLIILCNKKNYKMKKKLAITRQKLRGSRLLFN